MSVEMSGGEATPRNQAFPRLEERHRAGREDRAGGGFDRCKLDDRFKGQQSVILQTCGRSSPYRCHQGKVIGAVYVDNPFRAGSSRTKTGIPAGHRRPRSDRHRQRAPVHPLRVHAEPVRAYMNKQVTDYVLERSAPGVYMLPVSAARSQCSTPTSPASRPCPTRWRR